jgi:prepilin-type processing-associated H-X9-DG protein
MPHIERKDVYDSFQSLAGQATSGNSPLISMLLCPSSPPDVSTDPSLGFVGNCGKDGDGTNKGDGVMFDASGGKKIGLDYVTSGDGSVNTLLFTERNGDGVGAMAQWIFTSSPPPAVYSSATAEIPGFVHPADPSLTAKVINAGSLAPYAYPSAMHPGGVTAGFCDGHVIFLRDSISGVVYSQLLTSKTGAASTSPFNFRAGLPLLNDGDFQ